MKIRNLVTLIEGTIVCGEGSIENEVSYAFASDLMSDVLRVSNNELLLITGLANLQAIRTAEMSDISYLVIARNKKISPEMKTLAEENGMVIIESPFSMFRISGELYAAGIKPLF